MRVLFVDDQVAVLDLFSMILAPMADKWDVHYASTPQQALAMVEKQAFDVIISDMRMPGMNGAVLLSHVMKLQPRSARLIMSGYSDQEEVAASLGAAHQFLKKPCDLITLKATLARVCSLDIFLRNETLKALASRMTVLPSVPMLYFQLLKEVESPSSTAESLGKVVAQDPAITAKLLQLVNSAFFGIARKVVDPADAVQLLGVNTVRALALTLQTFSCFEQAKAPAFSISRMWERSMRVGQLSRHLARWAGAPLAVAEESFVAGLLHDLGKLMLVANMPAEYSEAMTAATAGNIQDFDAEQQRFGATHADLGGYLLGLWGLPVTIVEAVALHHSPSSSVARSFSPLTAVHIASVLASERAALPEPGAAPQMDMGYLAGVGVAAQIESWRSQFAESEAAQAAESAAA
jgi:HD-like signal output (HDOD) protein